MRVGFNGDVSIRLNDLIGDIGHDGGAVSTCRVMVDAERI